MVPGISFNPSSFDLNSGAEHPLRGESVRLIPALFDELAGPSSETITAEKATLQDLLSVHSRAYVDEVLRRARSGHPLTPETPLSPELVESHLGTVGGALSGLSMLLSGRTDLVFAPGGFHHAGRDYGGGFCVFNDVAICASMAHSLGVERVMIVDTDAHAGNGTMDIFYEDPSVMFVSIHQDPRTLFPGRGGADERGSGKGMGYTFNIPIPPRATGTAYVEAIKRIVAPLMERFKPGLLIRNGGSDPHRDDPLTDLMLSYQDLYDVTSTISVEARRRSIPQLDLILSGYGRGKIEGWRALMAGSMGIEYDADERIPSDPSSERANSRAMKVIAEIEGQVKDA
jgi:acetoin utilization protein AcuC